MSQTSQTILPDPPTLGRPLLRVLHVLHSLRRAGAEMLAYEMAAANRDSLATGIVVLDELGSLADDFRAIDVPIWHTRRTAGFDRTQSGKIAKILRDFRPSVIHAHQYTPFFYACLAQRKTRFGRLLFTEHGRCYPDVVGWKRRLVNRLYLAGKADKVTAVCEWTRRALVGNEGFRADAIEVVYNGVELQSFAARPPKAEVRQQWGIPAGAMVIVQVGNLRAVKDHPTALRAFAHIAAVVTDAVLVLAGDGPDRPKLERQAEELDISQRVRFLGAVREIPSLLACSDVMLMTSVSEAHSVSLLEGMASSLPIVATAVGGIPETVEDGTTGLLAPRGDDARLAEHLLTLLGDVDLRRAMGAAGLDRARHLFQRKDMHRRYLDIYSELAAAGGVR